MMQMVDEFTVAVTMPNVDADELYESALRFMRPRIEIHEYSHSVGNVMHTTSRMVSVDDVRVRFEYDQDSDLSYVEQFDNADDYNEWCEREGALNTRERFVSMRPETRQFDGLRFKLYHLGRVRNERDYIVKQGRCSLGEYYVVKFTTRFSHGTDDPRHGAIRLAHKSEIHQTFDEYQDGWGDLDNYVSYGAILEVRDPVTDEWNNLDSIWGCDFYIGPGGDDDTPNDDTYTLSELKGESFRWIAEHFSIDWDQVPDA